MVFYSFNVIFLVQIERFHVQMRPQKFSLQGISDFISPSIGSNLQLADAVVLGASAVKNVPSRG